MAGFMLLKDSMPNGFKHGRLSIGEQEIGATVSQMSIAGLAVEISLPVSTTLRRALAAGARVHVAIELAQQPLVLSGRVFWSNASYSAAVHLLVELESIDAAVSQILGAWIEKEERERCST